MANQIAKAIAESAVRAAVQSATNLGMDEISPEQAGKIAKNIVEQDKVLVSKRLWSSLLGILSFILLYPGVQNELMTLIGKFVDPIYLPMATVLVGALLALLSKRADPRSVRS